MTAPRSVQTRTFAPEDIADVQMVAASFGCNIKYQILSPAKSGDGRPDFA